MSGDGQARVVDQEVDVGEDLRFQRRWWTFERIAWFVVVFFLAANLLGLFGRGPLAEAHWDSEHNDVHVTYERIEREGAPSQLIVSLDSPTLRGGTAMIHVSDSVIGKLGAQRIVPQPERSTIGRDGITYTFPTSDSHVVARLELSPVSAGRATIRVAALGAVFETSVLVLP